MKEELEEASPEKPKKATIQKAQSSTTLIHDGVVEIKDITSECVKFKEDAIDTVLTKETSKEIEKG